MKIIILVEEGGISAAYAAPSATASPEILIVDLGEGFDDEEPIVDTTPLQPIDKADEIVRKAIGL